MGEGVLTDMLRIVYEIIFLNAPKTLYFARDFLMAGITELIAALYDTIFQEQPKPHLMENQDLIIPIYESPMLAKLYSSEKINLIASRVHISSSG